MREVGDNDVLYGFVGEGAGGSLRGLPDPDGSTLTRAQEVARVVMEGLGYRLIAGPDNCHMGFSKDPGISFELHHALFDDLVPFRAYYSDPWRLARARRGVPIVTSSADRPAGFELELSSEDEYVYLMAHIYKHSLYPLQQMAHYLLLGGHAGLLSTGEGARVASSSLKGYSIGRRYRMRGASVPHTRNDSTK